MIDRSDDLVKITDMTDNMQLDVSAPPHSGKLDVYRATSALKSEAS
jgi:hypothetical protein